MNNISVEHLGLATVHRICAEMNAIWRATANNDLGVDGQIEFLENDTVVSTGLICAVQVKSGASYFREVGKGAVIVRVPKRTRDYWSRLSMPMFLIVHNSENGTTLFVDVKSQLGVGSDIRVPLDSVFFRCVP